MNAPQDSNIGQSSCPSSTAQNTESQHFQSSAIAGKVTASAPPPMDQPAVSPEPQSVASGDMFAVLCMSVVFVQVIKGLDK